MSQWQESGTQAAELDSVSEQPQDDLRRFRVELDGRYRAALMTYFLRRVNDRAEAEDLTQEVFVRLVGQSQRLAPESASGFVFTVAANLLRDRSRRSVARQLQAHRSIDDHEHGSDVASSLVEDRGPERVLLGRETLQEALNALAELGERTRDIFVLFRLENMRQQEIAALYGLSVSAVEKHVVKAAAHLAARFRQRI